MVASRKVHIPVYNAAVRQWERGFGALGQFIGRTAFPFLRNYIVPAARHIEADMLKLAVPKIAEVVSGWKNITPAAKNVGWKL